MLLAWEIQTQCQRILGQGHYQKEWQKEEIVYIWKDPGRRMFFLAEFRDGMLLRP